MGIYILIQKLGVIGLMKKFAVVSTMLAVLALAACGEDTEDEDTGVEETGVEESDMEDDMLDDSDDDDEEDSEIEDDD